MTNLFGKIRYTLKNGNSRAKRKWLRFIGLTAIELIMVALLALPFLETTAAHPALPDDLETNPQMIDPAEFGPQIDTPPVKSGPEAAIPVRQGVTTTLTVSIETSNEAVVDSNGVTPSGFVPEVFVIEAAVKNTGAADATNVVITLDYNESAPWVLVSGEDPVRTVDNLGAGQTTYVYWFAQHNSDDAAVGTTAGRHKYTISAVADNATLVSNSQNRWEPNPNRTVKTVKYQDTANQGLSQATLGVDVGVAFTMTQVFTTGQNPVSLLFNPVGNSTFDAGAYRLLSVSGRAFDSTSTEIATFSKAVSVTVPITTETVEVNYNFVALLPADTSLCSYMGVIASNSSRKYDQNYCTVTSTIHVDGGISLVMTKQVDVADAQQGRTLQYTINYQNTSLTQTINYGWIWDEVPTGVSILTPTIDPPSNLTETTATRVAWNIGTIGPGATGQLKFSALIDGGGTDIPDLTDLVNEANFGINPNNTVPARSALSSTVTTKVHAPVITVTKTDGKTTANPGNSLTYVITITNTGSVPATSLVVTDVFPDDVLIGTPNIAPTSQNGQTLVWNFASLAANTTTITIVVPAQVDPDLSDDGKALNNNVEVGYQNSLGHAFSPETANDTTTVIVPTSALTLTKTAQDLNGAPLVEGDLIRYTIGVTNIGTFTAYDVTVTDNLPNQVTCQSVGPSNPPTCNDDPLVWQLGNLGINQGKTITIEVKINNGTQGAKIVNSASVTGTNIPAPPTPPQVCPDGNDPPCASIPNSDTTLDLNKTAEDGGGTPDVLEVGDTVTYTLWITNTGNYTAFDVTVTDDLSQHVTCKNTIPDPPGCADPLTWNVGNLPPNGQPGYTASLMIIVEILASGENQHIINSAVATGTNVFDPPPVPEVCPDGSTPTGGLCPVPDGVPGPDPSPDGVYLPIITKN